MNKIKLAFICTIVLLGSCNDDRKDDPIIPEPTPTVSAQIFEHPSWSFSLQGDESQPTWSSSNPHEFSGSMVGYVALPSSLVSDIDGNDVLGVFYGEECRFVTHIDDATQIPVIVMGNNDETGHISLRYYSNKHSMSFIAENVTTFGIDKECGLLSPDFVPSKYPTVMTADLQITLVDATSGNEQIVSQSSTDMLAALIGDDCRAVVSGNSSGNYTLTVYGNSVGENVEIQYYQTSTKHKFRNSLQLQPGKQSTSLRLNVITEP